MKKDGATQSTKLSQSSRSYRSILITASLILLLFFSLLPANVTALIPNYYQNHQPEMNLESVEPIKIQTNPDGDITNLNNDAIKNKISPSSSLFQSSQNVLNYEPIDNTDKYISHLLTATEVEELKLLEGVYKPGENYNQLRNGFGTGLAPPTENEWSAMIGTVEVVEAVESATKLDLPGTVDHSSSQYFPIVSSQGSSGSCTAWAVGYYAHGFYQAREYDWTQASTGNNDQRLSPSWTYNKANKGYDGGSSFYRNWKVLNTIGACTWTKMPFSSGDCLSWGDEAAWREAPKYRANSYVKTNAKNIDVLCSWLNDGYILPISIHSSIYDGLGPGDDTVNSIEMNTTAHNHANALVGYDDSKMVDGERGAFKIVNSWGINWGTTKGGWNGSGGWDGDGFYWMTYKAFSKLTTSVYMFYDKVEYSPKLIGTWEFSGNCSRDSKITLGIGTASNPIATRDLYRYPTDHFYPRFLCLDITESYDSAGLISYFLKIQSGTNKTNISSFKLEMYEAGYTGNVVDATLISGESPDVPKKTPCSVTNWIYGYQVNIDSPKNNQSVKNNIQTTGTTNSSISELIIFEDFENQFPGAWTVGDNSQQYGFDYWGNSSYRSNSGFRSSWCAGVQEPIFLEGFDKGGTLPVGWARQSENLTNSQPWSFNNSAYDYVYNGDDYGAVCYSNGSGPGTNITEWLINTSGFNASEYPYLELEFLLAYNNSEPGEFAEVLFATNFSYPNFSSLANWTEDTFGIQHLNLSAAAGYQRVYLAFRYHGTNDSYMFIDDVAVTTNNGSENKYEPGMDSYMYQPIDLTKHDLVTLTYDYWLDCEPNSDVFSVMYYSDSVWHTLTEYNGTSSGWKSANSLVPKNASYIGFWFYSDHSIPTKEGAYLDNIKLTGQINLSTVELRLDSGAWSNVVGVNSWSYPINTQSYSDGAHEIEVRAKFGVNYTYDFVDVIFDNSPPYAFTPQADPDTWSSNYQPEITFEAIDIGSGIARYEVKIDDGIFSVQDSPYKLPILQDGNHTITVRAFDFMEFFRDGIVMVYVDASFPQEFKPVASPRNWTNTQPIITFSTEDIISDVDYYKLKIDDGNFSNQTSPYVFPNLVEGIHIVSVRAYDLAGNYKEGNVNIYIDIQSPNNFTPTATPSTWTNNSRPEILFNTSDNLSGIDRYELKLNSGDFSTVESPYTMPALNDGTHNITIRAFDRAGNYMDGYVDVYIDATPPSTFQPKAVPNDWTNESVQISFQTSDARSGVTHFEVKINDGIFSEQSSPLVINESDLNDGVNPVTVRAYDLAGNYFDGTVNIYFDSINPNIEITKPLDSSWLADSVIQLGLEYTDVHSGIGRVVIQVDDWPEIEAGVKDFYNLTNLPDGTHTVNVTVYDQALNNNSDQIMINIDRLGPVLSIIGPNVDSYLPTAKVNIEWESNDDFSGIDNYMIKLDDGRYSNISNNDYTILGASHMFKDLSEGAHTVHVKAIDRAGNFEEESISFYVDITKPTISINSPLAGEVIKGPNIDCTWSGSDNGSGISYYQIRIEQTDFTDISLDTNHSFSDLSEGPHKIYLRAVDQAGNMEDTTVEFTIDLSIETSDTEDGGADYTGVAAIITVVIIVVIMILLLLFIRKRKKLEASAPDMKTESEQKTKPELQPKVRHIPMPTPIPNKPFPNQGQISNQNQELSQNKSTNPYVSPGPSLPVLSNKLEAATFPANRVDQGIQSEIKKKGD